LWFRTLNKLNPGQRHIEVVLGGSTSQNNLDIPLPWTEVNKVWIL
jgi:hypothetical protein